MSEPIAPVIGMTVLCYSERSVPPDLAEITKIHSNEFVDVEGDDAEGEPFHFTNINLIQADEDAEQLPYVRIQEAEKTASAKAASSTDDADSTVV